MGFELSQTINLTVYPHKVKITEDAGKIYLTSSSKFYIIERASDGIYEIGT